MYSFRKLYSFDRKCLNRDRKFSGNPNLLSVSFHRIMSRNNIIVLLNRDEMCPVRKKLFEDLK